MSKIALLDEGGNTVSEARMPRTLPAVVEFPACCGNRSTVTHVCVAGRITPLDRPVEIQAVEADGRAVPMFPRLSLR